MAGREDRSDAFLLWQPALRTGFVEMLLADACELRGERMTRLDLSGCEKLGRLYCYDNRLETLNCLILRRYSVNYTVMGIG